MNKKLVSSLFIANILLINLAYSQENFDVTIIKKPEVQVPTTTCATCEANQEDDTTPIDDFVKAREKRLAELEKIAIEKDLQKSCMDVYTQAKAEYLNNDRLYGSEAKKKGKRKAWIGLGLAVLSGIGLDQFHNRDNQLGEALSGVGLISGIFLGLKGISEVHAANQYVKENPGLAHIEQCEVYWNSRDLVKTFKDKESSGIKCDLQDYGYGLKQYQCIDTVTNPEP